MKDKIVPLLIVFGFSVLCVFIVIVPWNTLSSPLNWLAAPFVCLNGVLTVERDTSTYIQGEQTHTVTANCIDEETYASKDVSSELIKVIGKLQIISGVVLSLVLFALAMLTLRWVARRLNIPFEDLFKPSVSREK